MRSTVLETRALTAELLTFTRLGEGAPDLVTSTVDVSEIVEDVAARWPGTQVHVPRTEVLIQADARLVFRAVDNLVANAVRYATPPIVSVREVGGMVYIEVTDEGPGVPVADQDRIFEPFVRLESSRSKDTGGTGLGLAMVRRIARRHGGDCTLDDSDGSGATFVIRLAGSI